LPHELTQAQRKELLSAFVLRFVEKHGVFADVAIHEAHDWRNIHAHILLSHRELGPDGFGDIANRHTITRKHRGEIKQMTTAGIATTPAEMKALRKDWASAVNRAYEKAGYDIRVDHRSFVDRGIDEVPTIHLGPAATAMERDGKPSDRGDINRSIQQHNAELDRLKAEKERQDAAIIDLQAKRAERAAQQHDVQSPHLEQPGTDELGRNKHSQAENEDMDDDIAAKQREERRQAEDRQAAIYNDRMAERNRFDPYILDWQKDHETGERNRRSLQEAQWRREAEGDITDVRARALLAAGESRDFVQAVRREGAMITAEHAELQRDIALEKDPDKKQLLALKRDIQHADYMALANERIAAMSNLNGEQYNDAMQKQEAWAKIGTDLRKERIELQERMADREMDAISEAVERTNAADRQRAGFRADIRGSARTETPREAAQEQYAGAAPQQPDNRKGPLASLSVRQKRSIWSRPARNRKRSGVRTPMPASGRSRRHRRGK
jgi:hypothetical protein